MSGPELEPSAFLTDLEQRQGDRLRAKVRLSPRRQPIASDADPDSCLRRQVLEVVRWKDKEPIPWDRQGRLEAGDDAEAAGLRHLREMRFNVVKEQVPFEHMHRRRPVPALSGRIDAFVMVELEDAERRRRVEVPFELKSVAPWVYSALRDEESLSRFWWTKRHRAQAQAYLIGYASPWGVIYYTNLLGEWKPILIRLDYAFAERVLSFAERIVDEVDRYRRWDADPVRREREAPPLPDFASDPTECARCPFFGRACNPPIREAGAAVWEDPDFESLLDRWRETRDAHREHVGLNERVKSRLKMGPDRQVVGAYMVNIVRRPSRTDVDIARLGDREEG